jgi:hypothetical protein
MKIDVWFAVEDEDTGGAEYYMGDITEFDDVSMSSFFEIFGVAPSYTFNIINNKGDNDVIFEDIAQERGLFQIKLFPHIDYTHSITLDAELLFYEMTGETDLSVTVKIWAGSLYKIYDEPTD